MVSGVVYGRIIIVIPIIIIPVPVAMFLLIKAPKNIIAAPMARPSGKLCTVTANATAKPALSRDFFSDGFPDGTTDMQTDRGSASRNN